MYWPHACPAPAALMFDFGRGSRGLSFPPGWSGRHPGLRSDQGSAIPLAPLLLYLSSLQAPPPSPHSWSCLMQEAPAAHGAPLFLPGLQPPLTTELSQSSFRPIGCVVHPLGWIPARGLHQSYQQGWTVWAVTFRVWGTQSLV